MGDVRLNISKEVKTKILPKIDQQDYLGLSNDSCERVELFLLAMALGIEKGIPPTKTPSISLVRAESIKLSWRNLMLSSFIASFDNIESEVKKISDDNEIAAFASRYAELGFSELNRIMSEDADAVLEDFTSSISNRYKRFVRAYPELELCSIQ